MKLKNRYFILRHGQTIYQTEKKDFIYPSEAKGGEERMFFDYPPFPEKPPIKLTKKGEGQIKKIADLLKKKKIHLIYSSDFFRTKQTAGIVARELGLKIIFDKRLRDINLGIYRGGMKEKFYQDFQKYSEKRFYKRPFRGESWSDTRKRMTNFLKDIDKRYKGKKILVISHGDPLWLLEGAAKNWSIEKLLKIKMSKNYIKTGELRRL